MTRAASPWSNEGRHMVTTFDDDESSADDADTVGTATDPYATSRESGASVDGGGVSTPSSPQRLEPLVVVGFSAVSMHRTGDDAALLTKRIEVAMEQLEQELRLRRDARLRSRGSSTVMASNDDSTGAVAVIPTEEAEDEAEPDPVEVTFSIEHRATASCAFAETSPMLFLKPNPPLYDVSGEPLIPSMLVHRITSMRAWPAVLAIVAAIGVGLSTVALGFADTTVKSIAYMVGFACLLIPLLLHTFMYRRGVCMHIATSFEFWYLSFQIIVFSACETVQGLSAGLPLWVGITPRIVLTGVACVGLLCIDGSSLSRVVKGFVMAVAAVLFAGLGLSWRFNSAVADDVITILGVTTTVGSLATSAYATLGVFCGRFAMNLLVLKRPIVLITFTWVEDDITHQRRFKAPPPLQRRHDE